MTVNTNLNADLLDGLKPRADFLQATSPITISGTAPALIFSDTTSSALDYQIVVDADRMTIEETGGNRRRSDENKRNVRNRSDSNRSALMLKISFNLRDI